MKLQESIDNIQGYLESIEEADFRQIEFDWEGIHFKANSDENRAEGPQIRVQANMGRLYYTVEDQINRALAIDRVYATNRGIDGAYQILPNGDVRFESVTKTDHIMDGKDLMGALTLIILEAETHLRALRTHLKT